MNVLILGCTGHVGRRLLQLLQRDSRLAVTGASRGKPASYLEGANWIQTDSLDIGSLSKALKGQDIVVNCVAGSQKGISQGAEVLTKAARIAGSPRIVHLSTMSVYGFAEGLIDESFPLSPALGWYAKAKCEAEAAMEAYAIQGGHAIILRPGCIFGPGSELWVGRVGRWLKAGRLGDLGINGDGWSNLVHVDDVCHAILASFTLPVAVGKIVTFNIAAPDSPRWNDYFVDLALAMHSIPVRRITRWQLKIDSLLAGPPLKFLERLKRATKLFSAQIPDAVTPGLVLLWGQHIHLDSRRATSQLKISWTSYENSLKSSATWFSR